MQNRVKLVRHDDDVGNGTGGARFESGPLVWRPDLYFAPVEKKSLEQFHEDTAPSNTDQRTQPKEEAKDRQKTVSSRHRILLVFILLLSVACVVMFMLPRARSFTDEELGLSPITNPSQKKVANPVDWDPLTYWHHRWSQCETWASGCRNGWGRCLPPNGVYIRNFDRRNGKAVSKELYLSCLNHENRALEIAREVVRKKKDDYASARLCEAYSLSMIAQTMLQAKDVIEFDKQLVVDNALESYEIHRHLLGEGHEITLESLVLLGRSLSYQGHMQKAYDCYIKALEIAADSFGKPSDEYHNRFGNLMTFLSEDMHLGRKQFGEMYNRFYSTQHEWKVPGELPGMDGYPSVYGKLLEGKYKEADELYHTAVRELASIDGLTSTRLYHCANSYACALEAQGRTQEAQKLRSALNCGQRQKKVANKLVFSRKRPIFCGNQS